MEAPAGRMGEKDLAREFAKHAEAHYELRGDGAYVCKKCGAEVLQVTCYVSVHATEFGDTCAGPGKVWHMPLFYCPACEGEPKNVSTCVHVPMFGQPIEQTKLPVPTGC